MEEHDDSAVRRREFLSKLDEWWQHEYRPPVRSELPFTGGWFLFLGYELAAEIARHKGGR